MQLQKYVPAKTMSIFLTCGGVGTNTQYWLNRKIKLVTRKKIQTLEPEQTLSVFALISVI